MLVSRLNVDQFGEALADHLQNLSFEQRDKYMELLLYCARNQGAKPSVNFIKSLPALYARVPQNELVEIAATVLHLALCAQPIDRRCRE